MANKTKSKKAAKTLATGKKIKTVKPLMASHHYYTQ